MGSGHITQEKTGSKLAIPLALKSDALNMSLREVVSRCRDRVVSQYLSIIFIQLPKQIAVSKSQQIQ